jgi:N-acetylglucosamine-6-sulfatase
MTESPGTSQAGDRSVDGLLTRREALARLGMAGLALTSAGTLLSACRSASRSEPKSPNVLLIIADDMRYDHLKFMPNVRRLIADEGRTFTQARCNVPLCQPSRVGLMTGQTSRFNNELGVGFNGTKLTDNDNCLGRWMNDAGYRCGFFGKYVNFTDGFGGIDAPAGYHTWRELTGETNGYQFKVHLNTGTQTIKGQYGTDYLASQANPFLEGVQPFFCVVTPTQPHTPFFPRRDLSHEWLDVKWPVVDEVDVSDKPPWIQALPPLTAADVAQIQTDAIGALQELSAVDDMVAKILTGMDQAVLANTVVVFTSDNGVHHGEHRRRGAGTKSGPYEVALHVPLLVRGPGFAPGPAITVPCLLTQDIAATILDVGDAKAGLPHQAGVSLVELCAHPSAQTERILLHEVGEGFVTGTGDGITTGPGNSRGFRKLYRYPSARERPNGPYVYEAYDMDSDPNEFSNWANDPARRSERDALEAELHALLEA